MAYADSLARRDGARTLARTAGVEGREPVLTGAGARHLARMQMGGLMAKEDVIEMEGVVAEILPGGQFRVQLEHNVILAYTAGKMRKNRIRTMVGDRVTIEMTPYDLTRGRLIYRHKSETPQSGTGARRVYRPRR
jgi:translation initiation factor IF-1